MRVTHGTGRSLLRRCCCTDTSHLLLTYRRSCSGQPQPAGNAHTATLRHQHEYRILIEQCVLGLTLRMLLMVRYAQQSSRLESLQLVCSILSDNSASSCQQRHSCMLYDHGSSRAYHFVEAGSRAADILHQQLTVVISEHGVGTSSIYGTLQTSTPCMG